MSYEKQTWATGDTISGAKLNHIEEGVEGINMSYEKTTWQSGDTITAEKLNNIEDGIAGAGGGSGDYTTAQVIMSYEGTGTLKAVCPFLEDGDMFLIPDSDDMDGETPFEVVLYNGHAGLSIISGGKITSVTGDITSQNFGRAAIISGNGTIVFNDDSPA